MYKKAIRDNRLRTRKRNRLKPDQLALVCAGTHQHKPSHSKIFFEAEGLFRAGGARVFQRRPCALPGARSFLSPIAENLCNCPHSLFPAMLCPWFADIFFALLYLSSFYRRFRRRNRWATLRANTKRKRQVRNPRQQPRHQLNLRRQLCLLQIQKARQRLPLLPPWIAEAQLYPLRNPHRTHLRRPKRRNSRSLQT